MLIDLCGKLEINKNKFSSMNKKITLLLGAAIMALSAGAAEAVSSYSGYLNVDMDGETLTYNGAATVPSPTTAMAFATSFCRTLLLPASVALVIFPCLLAV